MSTITKIRFCSKIKESDTKITYLFPEAKVDVQNTSLEKKITIYPNNMSTTTLVKVELNWDDITEKYGQDNIESYVDYLAENDHFLGPYLEGLQGEQGDQGLDGEAGPAGQYDTEVRVTSAETFLLPLDYSKVHVIDGDINMAGIPITIEAGKTLQIRGNGTGVSSLFSENDNYFLFVSAPGGSGNLFVNNLDIEISGAGSGVFSITGNTGFEAVELQRVNFNRCSSLGSIYSIRQYLETITGRIGGKPTLEFGGAWDGARISTSLVRQLGDDFTGPLFKAGAGFVMSGSFLTDIRADLGTNGQFCDFSPANFSQPDVLFLKGCRILRNGVFLSDYTTAIPNITPFDLESFWEGNIGLPTTIRGGQINLNSDSPVVISAPATYYDFTGTTTLQKAAHVDSPATWQLRNINNKPYTFTVEGQIVLSGTAGDVVDVKIVIYRAATMSFDDARHVRRSINNLVGPTDVAYYNLSDVVTLNSGDYTMLRVENTLSSDDVTILADSFYSIIEQK